MERSKRALGTVAMLGAVAALAVCGGEEKPPEPAAVERAARPSEAQRAALRKQAAQVFAERCARCHGVGGAGNGVESDELVPRPRNFQDPGWQRSVKDSYLERIIVEGGEAVGKAASMPAHPDLASQQALVTELRRAIRNFAR